MPKFEKNLKKQIETEKIEVKIVAGSMRGRKITVIVHDGLRPTPQAVREALFSILGNAVPDRQFIDLYAGSGVVGFEAISRGAKHAWLVERDPKQVRSYELLADRFEVRKNLTAVRSDSLSWAERWLPPAEPVTVFFSPPFPDLDEKRRPQFIVALNNVMQKIAVDSVVVVQIESGFPFDELPNYSQWDIRSYGRNILCFWVKDLAAGQSGVSGVSGQTNASATDTNNDTMTAV